MFLSSSSTAHKTLAYVAKPSCSQLLLIESATYVYAQDQFARYQQRSNEPLRYLEIDFLTDDLTAAIVWLTAHSRQTMIYVCRLQLCVTLLTHPCETPSRSHWLRGRRWSCQSSARGPCHRGPAHLHHGHWGSYTEGTELLKIYTVTHTAYVCMHMYAKHVCMHTRTHKRIHKHNACDEHTHLQFYLSKGDRAGPRP